MAHSVRRASSEAPPEGVASAAEPAPTQSESNASRSATHATTPRPAGPEAETAPGATGAASAVPDENSSPARAAEPHGSGEVAAASGMSPPTVTSPESSGGGPRKPILAGAAIVGAVLVAVPLLLVAGKSDPASRGSAVAADAAATLLEDGTESQNPGEFVPAPPAPTQSPAATRTKSGAPTSGSQGSASPTRRQIVSPGRKAVQEKQPPRKTETPKKQVSVPETMGTGRDATFRAGSKLCVNQAWTSHDGRTVLRLQGDRNLVLYRDGSAVWAAPGAIGRGDCAVLQTDGNFVLLDANHQPIWHPGPGAGPLI